MTKEEPRLIKESARATICPSLGIENFIIRFAKKWSTAVESQRKLCTTHREQFVGANVTDFSWVRDQAIQLPNPYAQQDDADEVVPPNSTIYLGPSGFESAYNHDWQ
jgi:hypothetical protein